MYQAVFFLTAFLASEQEAGLKAPDAPQVLSRMASDAGRFDAKELDAQGVPGLKLVLDWLLPETADSQVTQQQVAAWIEQLGDDNFRVREQASATLLAVGHAFHDAIVAATRSDDAEVRSRAQAILDKWKARQEDIGRYAAGFQMYVHGIKDRERLELLSRRTALALEKGLPADGRLLLLTFCLEGVARSGDDRCCDLLQPLLKHDDVRVAVMVTREIGSRRIHTLFPRLLLDALKSDREPVVQEAVNWTPNCWDRARQPEVRKQLRRIFATGSEHLKFRVCFPLMHGFSDPEALRHLMSETKSKDTERARTAIGWIGDSCNYRKPVTDELLATLTPFLKSDNDELRRSAVYALGTYAGEQVVQSLVPLLADKEAIIVSEASYKLLEQPDKAMLKRCLQSAAQNDQDPNIRKKTGELLAKLAAAR